MLDLANYHVLGGVFYYVPYLAPLEPGKVFATFGALSALIETLNALGVSLHTNTSSSASQQELGTGLITAALALQVAVIAAFVILAAIFHRPCSSLHDVPAVSHPLHTLYISTALIFARCVYRLVEATSGNTAVDIRDPAALAALSPALRYEAFFCVFEAALMLANSVLWNVRNPRRHHLPASARDCLARNGSGAEITNEGEDRSSDDARPLLARPLDPYGLFVRRGKKKHGPPYWEMEDGSDVRRGTQATP